MKPPRHDRDAIETALVASPLDAQTHLVYADLLQGEGDPLGELIAVQHARWQAQATEELEQLAREEHTLLESHAELVPKLDPGVEAALVWQLGFVRAAHLVAKANDRIDLSALLAHRCCRLTGLSLHSSQEQSAVLEALSRQQPPLEALLSTGPLAGVGSLRSLRVLRAEGRLLDAVLEPRLLQHLELQVFDDSDLSATGLSKLQELHTLIIDVVPAARAKLRAETIHGLLSQPAFALRHLGIRGAGPHSAELCRALINSPLLGALDSLDLSHGTLTTRELALLLRALPPQLKLLNVSDNHIERLAELPDHVDADIFVSHQQGAEHGSWPYRAQRHCDHYYGIEGQHPSEIGLRETLRETVRKAGIPAALRLYDSIPSTSRFRHGLIGRDLLEMMLRLLARADCYHSIIRLCREAPPPTLTEEAWASWALAELVAERPERAAMVASRVRRSHRELARRRSALDVFHDWARAASGDRGAIRQLERRIDVEPSRWRRFALAVLLQHGEPVRARRLLGEAREDLETVRPDLPPESAIRRLCPAIFR